ncbi:DegT/DnrJ/EryC1/StrS family aminotransferase [Cytobacillus sp. S13-E01]|uniref:DegT/DnrJ/EryC1/StrS family aminotransferase n=1 Tax=Cytobacillus sp. S13-E01 TaxID=3031326 RepID=UPI0023D82037|nr:DegT/DnrJ/EryC1/StrS family aminotransferase [Cytobacillus sp. S13-E01]MDF0727067.1 DegT/DnrJ/EryC1/StrS family aminotransferase [Cytobacillus sp. S13-E01]
MVNNINVTKPFLPPIEEYKKKIESIWESNCLTNQGPIHQEFEEKLKSYLGVKNVSLFANGHLALEIALKSLKLTGEVITTPFTFASTVHTLTLNGLKPVFCDIDPVTFNIDSSKIEELITPQTSAILAVHVFGQPCDVSGIEHVANKYGLKVIYDAAHAFGVEIDNQPIGRFGDISMFSLHATKVFHSVEGGILSYRDKSLKKTLEKYRNFGIENEDTVDLIGLNAKMSEFHAAMGVVNLDYINQQIEERKSIIDKYYKEFSSITGLYPLIRQKNVKDNYSYLPILIDEEHFGISRDQLKTNLEEHGIKCRKYFYPLCSDFQCYSFKSDHLQNAKNISNSILTLPLYSSLNSLEIEKICSLIKLNSLTRV